MDSLIGQQIGSQYVIKSLLGKQRGRRTFLAKNQHTGQLVVVKLMLFGPDFTWQDLKLFEREAETLKALDHSTIPKYLDSFELEIDGWKGFALVQTYIEAKSLKQWVESGRTYQEGDLRAIATQLLIILSYLHSRYPAVIHRDIKPSNILFKGGSDGEPNSLYLVDFGSVHTISQSGTLTVVGTYGY
ncbi:MAG: protein kinase, partial [Cyanobacteria bacterium J06650_10]